MVQHQHERRAADGLDLFVSVVNGNQHSLSAPLCILYAIKARFSTKYANFYAVILY